MEFILINTLFILLLVAFFVTTLCRYLTIPSIVGYILVGILLGPHVSSLLDSNAVTADLAEIGIVFLMFAIGLEFSLDKLIRLKNYVFVYGGLQVGLSILITTIAGLFLGMQTQEAIVVGCVVAMSSTAIVVKQLTEQYELHTPHGNASFAILLFQDLAVIPMFILLPNLGDITLANLSQELLLALFKGMIAILVILGLGRWLLKPIFYTIASTRSLELFTLKALLVTVGASWLTGYMGLSLALGAFLAGMMIGETEFRHQIEADIRPFRDVFLGFFFITLGLQFDLSIVFEAWQWMMLLLLALFGLKILLIATLGLCYHDKTTALRTGIILAHGGEFGFAILALALGYELLPKDYGQVVLGALLLSMVLAPFMIRYSRCLSNWLGSKDKDIPTINELKEPDSQLCDHVVICGYGRVGQNIARFLEKAGIQYVALDLDGKRVHDARMAGFPVVFGDASHHDVLEKLSVKNARACVITYHHKQITMKTLSQIRLHSKRAPIVVRSYDELEVDSFYQAGATEVIPEKEEGSLMLASHILLLLKVPSTTVMEWIEQSRHDRYDLLRMIFPSKGMSLEKNDNLTTGLRVLAIEDNAYAIGLSIDELKLHEIDVRITAIRRQGARFPDPKGDMKVIKGDILVLFGPFNALEKAERIVLNRLK